jgi:hypothetical protein
MLARMLRCWPLLSLSLVATGCTWLVAENNERAPDELALTSGIGLEGELADGVVLPLPVGCDDSGPAPTSASLVAQFSLDIYPAMVRETGGCIACHATDSGRLLTMGDTPEETFARLRTQGMLGDGPGSMLDRVERDSMPQGGPFWSAAEKDALADLVCEVARFEVVDDTLLDEIFPPALEEPWLGAPSTEYDNTFLTFDQLRGRVATQFGDDWVRNDVDRFTENISLFGGVDFENAFIPARGATPEFLAGLSLLAPDVCGQAAAGVTGPFAGLDLAAPIREAIPESTFTFTADLLAQINGAGDVIEPPPFNLSGTPLRFNAFINGGGRATFDAPGDGDYEVTVLAEGREAGPDLPRLEIRSGAEVVGFDVPEGSLEPQTAVLPMTAGSRAVDAVFVNDFFDQVEGDRNMLISTMTIRGPLAGSTDTAAGARAATLVRLSALFERILLRAPKAGEVDPLYDLLIDVEAIDGDRSSAYAGVCEALLHHPDFLFTRPPSADESGADRTRALVVKTALDLLDRPPTADELARFDLGASRVDLVNEWVASADFRAAYLKKMKILLEADGSPEGDEPARLLTHLMVSDRPVQEALTATYSVDEDLAEVTRPAEHGATGVLTMAGYIKNKPGLPHYNYPARVLSGFLGYVFEVPPEVFDQRATATAASTVDPEAICFNCHQLLTPLAHQRLKWDDDGNYRELDDQGAPLDDSDRDLVEGYPFPGVGMEAFATQAVRKEGFIRRMANVQFQALMGRPMRHDADERVLYRALWDAAAEGQGTPRDLLEAILTHPVYVDPTGTTGEAQ